jgi:hypothetical protein
VLDVTNGVIMYYWDGSAWTQATGAPLADPVTIKTLYESNNNTNAFLDTDVSAIRITIPTEQTTQNTDITALGARATAAETSIINQGNTLTTVSGDLSALAARVTALENAAANSLILRYAGTTSNGYQYYKYAFGAARFYIAYTSKTWAANTIAITTAYGNCYYDSNNTIATLPVNDIPSANAGLVYSATITSGNRCWVGASAGGGLTLWSGQSFTPGTAVNINYVIGGVWVGN